MDKGLDHDTHDRPLRGRLRLTTLFSTLVVLLAVAAFMGWVIIPALSDNGTGEQTGATPGRIAFLSDRDGNFEIYVMNEDGSQQTRLTDTPANESSPTWSADGQRIAFLARANNETFDEIFVMNADGSGLVRLTFNDMPENIPIWSPDGTAITCISFNQQGLADLRLIHTDGSGELLLSADASGYSLPTWSPDSQRITFITGGQDKRDVAIINRDGSNLTVIETDTFQENDVRWSPDGAHLAVIATQDNRTDIFVTSLDGSSPPLQLTDTEDREVGFSWSPDGSRLAFSQPGADGSGDLFVIGADGSNQTRIAGHSPQSPLMSWSPDGSRLAFTATNEDYSNPTIYAASADGTGLVRLLEGTLNGWGPVWTVGSLGPERPTSTPDDAAPTATPTAIDTPTPYETPLTGETATPGVELSPTPPPPDASPMPTEAPVGEETATPSLGLSPTPTPHIPGARVITIEFWPDVDSVDRASAFDFGVRFDYESANMSQVRMLAFYIYRDQAVPEQSVCMGSQMPGRSGEVFWSTGMSTSMDPGINHFEQPYTYSADAPDDATHLVMWLILEDASGTIRACWQKAIELVVASQ